MTTESVTTRIYEMALREDLGRVREPRSFPAGGEPGKLEIIFYGMACFARQENGSYWVLFPNGLDEANGVPIHAAGVWVRDRHHLATTKWQGLAWRNDYFLADKRSLRISGLEATTLERGNLEEALVDLKRCDPAFTLSAAPDAVIDMTVDRGKLSVHVVNDAGMMVVRWEVTRERGGTVRFTLGDNFVEIGPEVEQVMLANAGSSSGMIGEDTHFRLYRKLSTEPDKVLEPAEPQGSAHAQGTVFLREPTFGYGTPAAPPTPAAGATGAERMVNVLLLTPDKLCSPGFLSL